MDQKALYRKAAIDKLASPEQLDVLMKVTSPKGWIALATTGVLLMGVIVWSVVATIPTRVAGKGILLPGEFASIRAPARGPVLRILKSRNDLVRPGEKVAEIDIPDIEDQIRQGDSRFQVSQNTYRRTLSNYQSNSVDWDLTISRRNEEVESQQRILELWEPRRGDPNYAQNTVMANIDQANSNIGRLRDEISRVNQQKQLAYNDVLRAEAEMNDARGVLEGLEGRGERAGDVISMVSGRVLEVVKSESDTVAQGEEILRVLTDSGRGMEALFYVNSSDATKISVGDKVEIQPSAIQREIYGFLIGSVSDRSDVELSSNQILNEVGSDTRSGEILQSAPNPRRVRAILTLDDTPTGYRWSSGLGYESPLENISTVHDITVNVVVEERRPIDLVIPRITSALGF